MPISDIQTEANRRNAQHSTGAMLAQVGRVYHTKTRLEAFVEPSRQ